MRISKGRITEIISGFGETPAYQLDCPPELIPAPGQYLLVDDGEADSVVAVHLFRVGTAPEVFLQNPAFQPRHWFPGVELNLRGPLGRGFAPPPEVEHIALAAPNNSVERLLPLIAENPQADMAVFSDTPLPALPLAVEAYPFDELPDALGWADFLAMDLSSEMLPSLRTKLRLDPHGRLACAAQALILLPMPCGGLAECGVCAVSARKGFKLACKDGPVFDLNSLAW